MDKSEDIFFGPTLKVNNDFQTRSDAKSPNVGPSKLVNSKVFHLLHYLLTLDNFLRFL